MASNMLPPAEQPTVRACTVSRDVQLFELLIEDMEALLGDSWGDLGFTEAEALLAGNAPAALDFLALAIDDTDEEQIERLMDLIFAAKARDIAVVLIAEDVSPAALHRLLRSGADEFVPYPLPAGELAAVMERLRRRHTEGDAAAPSGGPAPEGSARDARPPVRGDGAVIAVHGLAGGVGATTFAVNLAWELATADKTAAPRVCILDLGLQFGSVATYLDLPRQDAVLELLTNIDAVDADGFAQALGHFDDRLHVLTAPPDLLPLDMLGPDEVTRLLDLARRQFDFVIVDMPPAVIQWSETVLSAAEVFFALVALDMRSAQNALRLKRALQAEDLPFDKLRFVLSRAPGFADLQGRSRARRLSESLGIAIDLHLPDGGRSVAQACDHGLPLASQAARNPLRREISKLAQSLCRIGRDDADAA